MSPRSTRSVSCHARTGFTLLEVLLTLALAVVLIGLVGGALRFYAVDMNVRDMDVRQTQLAAAVMQMIEDDLRAALHTEPVDTSGLEALLATTASNVSGGGGGDAGGEGGEDLSAAGIESDLPEEELEPETEPDLTTGVAVLQTPGLIGNQTQVQIDLSRLPRLEEYMAVLDESTANIDDIPSDLKTVSYFVQPAGAVDGLLDPLAQATGDTTSNTQSGGGLVRRSLARSATVYAASTGGLAMLNQTGEVLAPEITGIEFAYWDGITWLTDWSSDSYGELPMAVQVRLYMDDPATAITGEITETSSMRTFMHVVRLPLSRPIEEDAMLDEEQSGDSTTTDSAAGASGI